MSRTEFLIRNPRLVTSLAIDVGMPLRELDDFTQEVILQSLQEPDEYDPKKAKLSTYAGNFVKRRAIDYLRRLKRLPKQLIIDVGGVDGSESEPA